MSKQQCSKLLTRGIFSGFMTVTCFVTDITTEEEIYDFLTTAQQTVGIQDHYEYWKENKYMPTAGSHSLCMCAFWCWRADCACISVTVSAHDHNNMWKAYKYD